LYVSDEDKYSMDLSVLNHIPNINTEINIATIKAGYIRKTLAQIKGTNPFLLQKLPAIKKPRVIKNIYRNSSPTCIK
jgi:hypothetical protein